MKKILSLLALLMLCIVGVNAQDSEAIFTADVVATANVSFGKGTTEITSANATVTGGKMYAISEQTDAKNLIGKQGSYYMFCMTNNNTFFKIELDKPLAVGDVISAMTYSRTDTNLGLFLSTADSRPNDCSTKLSIATVSKAAYEALSNYTVAEGDGLVGATTVYIYRETAKSTYFNEFKITRVSSENPVTENKTIFLVPGPWDVTEATERYAAYVWTGEGDAKVESWIPFVENSGKLVTIIPSSFTGLILARMDGATTENNWDNKWNQTDDIDLTKIADQTIFTITGMNDSPTGKSGYTTSNPLQEARDIVNKVINLAKIADAEGLATEIAAAEEAAAGTDLEAMQSALETLWNATLPKTQDLLTKASEFAEKYGYTDVTSAIATVQEDLTATPVDLDKIQTDLQALSAVALPAAQDAIGKFEGYAQALDNADLTAKVADAKTALATGDFKQIIAAIKAAETPFMSAVQAYVTKVQNENIQDAGVQNALAAVVAAMGEETPSIVAIGTAVKNLVNAYAAYQLEQNPVYSVAGTTALTGYNWDTSKGVMTVNTESGLYEWTSNIVRVSDDDELKFKVVKNYDWATCWPENDWVITKNTFDGGAGFYTITITFDADTDTKEIVVTGVKEGDIPAIADNNVYFWQSPFGYVYENGGTAAYVNGTEGENRVNYKNGDYYTICLNGKKANLNDETPSANAGKIVVTLDEALEAGDEIAITAYVTKDSESSAWIVYGNGTTAASEVFGTANSPKTVIVKVSPEAAGSKTITMTRDKANTNLFITKLEITRPIEYYLVGSFNEWKVGDANYKLAKNEEAATEEYFITVDLPANTELKVWENTDKWFPADDAPNFTINDAGTYTIYFRPDGDGNQEEGWFKGFIYAAKHELTLNEEIDNTETLAAWNGKKADVTLTRTLQTGGWNTFCVPFAVDATTLESLGITAVKALASSSFENGVLTMNFANMSGLGAGAPYLVKVSANVENPTFKGVIVSNAVVPTVTDNVDFIPTLGKTTINGEDANTVLFLGAEKKLKNPTALPSDMKGFRAYFQLHDAASTARSFVLDLGDGETTGIIEIETMKNVSNEAIFDLQGRRVNSAAQKGVYIVNGKKTVIK